MPQGISPNPLNKISEVYLSQISEHHKKDADGNTIPHEDELNEVSKKTLGNYIKKASTDLATRSIKHGMSGGTETGGDPDSPENVEKINKRHSGIMKAADKLKKEEVEVDEAVSQAMKPSNLKKKAKLGAALDRLQALKVAKKKREMGEEIENEGIQYGIFKGDGKPKGAMAAFAKKDNERKGSGAMPPFAKKDNERRGSGAMASFAKKSKKVKMEALSNWKEDYVWEADEEQMDKEVKEKKVKNKIIINPKLGEAVEELGGQLLDVQEMSHDDKQEDPQMKSKMLRQRQLKKQVLLRKLQAVRQTGGEDIVASYEPEGEQLDEYGNPRVGVRLRVARAIDKVNPKPKMGSKRTAISNKLKMSSIKAETKRREQKENPYSVGKKVRMALGMSNEDYIPEEGYDIARDMGKIPPTKDKKDATTMPKISQPQKPTGGKSALDIVKADIRKKYGKDAIMDLGKK